MRLMLRCINPLQTGIGIGMREPAMVLPAVPAFVLVKQIFFRVLLILYIGAHGTGDAHRVEQDPVRVIERAEFMMGQFGSDLFRKTGTDQQQFMPVADLLSERPGCKIQMKFHRTNDTNYINKAEAIRPQSPNAFLSSCSAIPFSSR